MFLNIVFFEKKKNHILISNKSNVLKGVYHFSDLVVFCGVLTSFFDFCDLY